MAFDILEHTNVLATLLANETSFATVTLIAVRGSAPQILGAKAIITENGIVAGTIGGGKIEGTAIEFAQAKIAGQPESTCELVTWNLQTDIGMTCGGEVKLFFEFYSHSAWPIAVFGAGHVAQALVPMLVQLHCQVLCVDSRPEWLAKMSDHPKLKKRCLESPQTAVADLPKNTFFILMSKGHSTDVPVLAEILSTRDAPYIGVIGSKQKASAIRRDLLSLGIAPEQLNNFQCPIGKPLGNNTPAEISISIIAQLIERRDELGLFTHQPKNF